MGLGMGGGGVWGGGSGGLGSVRRASSLSSFARVLVKARTK